MVALTEEPSDAAVAGIGPVFAFHSISDNLEHVAQAIERVAGAGLQQWIFALGVVADAGVDDVSRFGGDGVASCGLYFHIEQRSGRIAPRARASNPGRVRSRRRVC